MGVIHTTGAILDDSTPLTKLKYRHEEFSYSSADHIEDIQISTDRILNIRDCMVCKLGTERSEVHKALCRWRDLGGFAERKGFSQLLRSQIEYHVSMLLRHCENKVGTGANLRRELPRNEVGCVAPHLLKNQSGVAVHRMVDKCGCTSARRVEVLNAKLRRKRDCKPLCCRRSADVSCANKKHVQCELSCSTVKGLPALWDGRSDLSRPLSICRSAFGYVNGQFEMRSLAFAGGLDRQRLRCWRSILQREGYK